MIYKCFYSIILIVSIGISQPAFAATRHCEGQVFARYAHTPPISVLNFTGKGTNTFENRARNLARDWIGRCGHDHFNKRWELIGSRDTRDLPFSCNNHNAFGITPGEVDIKSQIARQVCHEWGYLLNPPHNIEYIPVQVSVKSYGDKGCGNRRDRSYTWILSPAYHLTKQMCIQGY